MNKNLLTHLALFGANLIYAGNYTIAKEVMPEYIEPFGFILLRVIGAGLLFWTVHLMTSKERVAKKDLLLLAICGLFGVAINQMLFFKGLSLTTPINAALLMLTTPILVLIMSSIIIKERITRKKMIGVLLGCAGAVYLIANGGSGIELKWEGDLYIFINASSYGIYLVIVKPLMKKYSPLTIIKWVFTFGFIYVLPFGLEEFKAIDWYSFDTNIWIGTAYVVIGTTFFAYLLNTIALVKASPSVVGAYIYLQPVLAGVIALLASKDVLSPEKIIASVIIFLGVYLVMDAPLKYSKKT